MQKFSSATGQLIVVELGSEWPSLSGIEAFRSPGPRRVIAQEERETPAAFAVRASVAIDAAFGRGVALGAAVIACSERMDAAAISARVELGNALSSALAKAAGGVLLLVASDLNDGHCRQPLSALQTELTRQWQRSAVEVSLRFTGDPSSNAAEPKSRTANKQSRSKAGTRRVA